VAGASTSFVDFSDASQIYFDGININSSSNANNVATIHGHNSGIRGVADITMRNCSVQGPLSNAPPLLIDSDTANVPAGFGFKATNCAFSQYTAGADAALKFVNFGQVVIRDSFIGGQIKMTNLGIGSDGDFAAR
jgi:hypothetical protein